MAPGKYRIVGAKTSKARRRGECFEALAARRRSLFSADNKAARSTDGVPDSRAKHAGLELIWGMFQCSVPSPPAVVSVARSKEPEAICFALSGARNRRELAPGQHSAEVSPIETPSVRVDVFCPQSLSFLDTQALLTKTIGQRLAMWPIRAGRDGHLWLA
ncbi:hypothetical protein GGI35DRAFT_429955 [Trichoderma velutinum]